MYEKLYSISSGTLTDERTNQSIIDHLNQESLHEKIRTNHMTLAMVRPHSEQSVNFTPQDRPAEEVLEEHIESLGVHTKISMSLDDDAVAEFYSDVIDLQSSKAPEVSFVMRDRWQEFSHLMTSGPVVVALLESHNATAVEAWRAQLGHWNIEESRDTTTLRGRFGIHNHNNLFHGSDSSQAALREVRIIAECMERARR